MKNHKNNNHNHNEHEEKNKYFNNDTKCQNCEKCVCDGSKRCNCGCDTCFCNPNKKPSDSCCG